MYPFAGWWENEEEGPSYGFIVLRTQAGVNYRTRILPN
jgi:hypothetical protein